MPDDSKPAVQAEETPSPHDDFDQEVYTALRAAGASPEEAQSCLQASAPAPVH